MGEQYCFIRVPCHGALRLVERGTAETNVSLLRSVLQAPQELGPCFNNRVFRVAETDEDPSIAPGEKLLQSFLPPCWTNATLHSVCIAHKVHTGAVRTWQVAEHVITGAIHVYKTLSDGHCTAALVRTLRREIPRRLQVRVVASLHGIGSPEAEAFRRNCLCLFMPVATRPKRTALLQHVFDMMNGDWRDQSCLVHYCTPGCCRRHTCKARRSLAKSTLQLESTFFCSQ